MIPLTRVGPNGEDEVLTLLCARSDVEHSDRFDVGDSHTDVESFAIAGTAAVFDPDDRIDDAVVEARDLGRLDSLLRTVLE